MKSQHSNLFPIGTILIGILLSALPAFAQLGGKFGLPVLRISPYARPVAMGEAFTALATDVNVMPYNVAGLGNLEHILLSVHFNDWVQDTYHGAFEVGFPTRYGTIGLNFSYFDEGELVERGPDFSETGRIFNNSDILVGLGYGIRFPVFSHPLMVGVSGKYVYQSLVERTSSAVGLDAGVIYKHSFLSIGATLQNITLQKFKLSSTNQEYKLPETFRLGLGTRFKLIDNFKWNLGVDGWRYIDSADKGFRAAAGAEVKIGDVFLMRGGYKFYDDDISRWSTGFGVVIPMGWFGGSSTIFDYAYSPLDNLNSQAHRFSMTFNFGKEERLDPKIASEARSELDAARRARLEAEEARLAAQEAEGRLKDLERRLEEQLKRAQEIAARSPKEIEVKPQPGGNVLVTLRINFNFDKSDIRSDMYNILNNVSDILKTYDESQVFISGHTDSIGTDEYNIKLAERRMRSVMDYLARQGIAQNRYFNPVPYGEWMPLNDNSTPDKQFRNRRVEFLIYTGINAPELPVGSKVSRVYMQNDTLVVEGNGRLAYNIRFVNNPPRAVLILPKVYVADPKTVAVNTGNVTQARIAFHPEESTTWVVLDLKDTQTPPVIVRANKLLIVPAKP